MSGISPHKVVKDKSYQNVGFYSSKPRFPTASDTLGAVVKIDHGPYFIAKAETRKAHVGRQLYTNHAGGYFSKIVASNEPFSDKGTGKAEGIRKLGFTRGSALNRDDMSNIYDVLRYRQQLDQEIKTLARGGAVRRGSVDALGFDEDGNNGALGETRRGDDTLSGSKNIDATLSNTNNKMGVSMKTRLPQCETGYDRQLYVPEFVPKVEREIKYARDFGPYRTTMHDMGDGCTDPANIHAPENAKQNFTAKLREVPHLNSPGTLKRFV